MKAGLYKASNRTSLHRLDFSLSLSPLHNIIIQLYCPRGGIPLAAIRTRRNIKHHINMAHFILKNNAHTHTQEEHFKTEIRFKKKRKKGPPCCVARRSLILFFPLLNLFQIKIIQSILSFCVLWSSFGKLAVNSVSDFFK